MTTPSPSLRSDPSLHIALLATLAARLAVMLYGAVSWNTEWMDHLVKDVYTWAAFLGECKAGHVPYVDMTREYPVGAGLLYWLMAPLLNPWHASALVLVHALLMGAVDLANTALFYSLARRAAPARALLLTLLFSLNPTALVLGPVRFESVVVTFALLGYAAHLEGRPLGASLAWSLGAQLKWYPAFFLAIQEWPVLLRTRALGRLVRVALVFLTATVALNLPFVLGDLARHGHLEHWAYPYVFHVKRPLFWDTVLGVGQLWLGPLRWERFAGAWSLALMGAAIVVRPRLALPYRISVLCLAALVFNRVYSPQFHLWFYPFLLLALGEEDGPTFRRGLGFFVVLDLLNALVYPGAFTLAFREMGGFWPGLARIMGGPGTVLFSAAIVLRAGVVLALGIWLLRRPDAPDRIERSDPGQAGQSPG